MARQKVFQWLGGVMGGLLLCLSAQAAGLEEEPDKKVWSEDALVLPAFPDPVNLIEFTVGSRRGIRFFVDGQSISIGSDGVIRFVLVVIGSQGAQNISYEGMRCETGERRAYAFGHGDKTWSKARGDQWVKVRGDTNNHYVELYSSYFCANGVVVTTPDAVRQMLRKGGARAW